MLGFACCATLFAALLEDDEDDEAEDRYYDEYNASYAHGRKGVGVGLGPALAGD